MESEYSVGPGLLDERQDLRPGSGRNRPVTAGGDHELRRREPFDRILLDCLRRVSSCGQVCDRQPRETESMEARPWLAGAVVAASLGLAGWVPSGASAASQWQWFSPSAV